MDSFTPQNLHHIKAIFAAKTGVILSAPRPRRPRLAAMLLTAVLAGCFSMTALAVTLFSPLSGDELSLSAAYQGNGLVAIEVTNASDKELCFQQQVKLMRWSTSEEIKPHSDELTFGQTTFTAHTSGTMTIDLSHAYDLALLEQPLTDDHYYLVLTNNSFAFGQDWMCFIDFAQPLTTPQASPTTPSSPVADAKLGANIAPELRPYFASFQSPSAQAAIAGIPGTMPAATGAGRRQRRSYGLAAGPDHPGFLRTRAL